MAIGYRRYHSLCLYLSTQVWALSLQHFIVQFRCSFGRIVSTQYSHRNRFSKVKLWYAFGDTHIASILGNFQSLARYGLKILDDKNASGFHLVSKVIWKSELTQITPWQERKLTKTTFYNFTGCFLTLGTLSYGLWNFRQGKSQMSQYMMVSSSVYI